MCFNVNFNVFFKLIKVHLLVSELYTLRLCSFLNVTDKVSHLYKNIQCYNSVYINILSLYNKLEDKSLLTEW